MNLHRFMMRVSRGMAILGGSVLTFLVLMTSVSVVGNAVHKVAHWDYVQENYPDLAEVLVSTGIGPVPGNEEIVSMAMAFAIYAFMPFCQMTGGHATVDIFTIRFPVRVNRFIQLLVEVMFAGVLILIADRLFAGMQRMMKYQETSFFLEIPVWWAYAGAFAGALVSAIVSSYMVFVRFYELLTSRTVIENAGAEH